MAAQQAPSSVRRTQQQSPARWRSPGDRSEHGTNTGINTSRATTLTTAYLPEPCVNIIATAASPAVLARQLASQDGAFLAGAPHQPVSPTFDSRFSSAVSTYQMIPDAVLCAWTTAGDQARRSDRYISIKFSLDKNFRFF